jgi:hypothetical protein
MPHKSTTFTVFGIFFIAILILFYVIIGPGAGWRKIIQTQNHPAADQAVSSLEITKQAIIERIISEKVPQAQARLQKGTYTQDDADYILRPRAKAEEEAEMIVNKQATSTMELD